MAPPPRVWGGCCGLRATRPRSWTEDCPPGTGRWRGPRSSPPKVTSPPGPGPPPPSPASTRSPTATPWSSMRAPPSATAGTSNRWIRSEEHTSELQSRGHLVCRLLLEKKKDINDDSGRGRDEYGRATHNDEQSRDME